MLDMKLTETDLPLFFSPLKSLFKNVSYIDAHARVSINQIDSTKGALPVAVPDVNPKVARAWFVDESSGAILGTTLLTKGASTNGLTVWDNASAPLPVKLDTGVSDVGLVVALGGGSSTTCGQLLVTCYDAGASTTASTGLPATGIVHVRGWTAAGSGLQPSAPLARSVTLIPSGTCTDPYFSAATASCTFGVRAAVDFGTVNGVDQTTAVGATVSATVAGTSYPMTYSSSTKTWAVDGVPLAPSAGPVNVTLGWTETKGTQGGNGCKAGNGNKCTGSFGAVQRAFSASNTRSGPIQVAQVLEAGLTANSFERCSAVQTGCTHNLVARVGVKANLGNATSVNDAPVALRVIGGSQNQSLDCDPAKSQLKDELATGCAPAYQRNTGQACPAGASALWSTAQPWNCVAIQTGSATNQVPAGMNTRILGSPSPSTCTAPNHWSSFPNFNPTDPRLIEVFLTPFGSFSGSGSTTVPVTDFATFYITGWTGQGQGFNNPCQGNGDDPVPNNDAGYIVGHFVKYINTLNTGGSGSSPCDLSAFGTCIAVLTR
jgi:hypothetical protein